MKRSNIHLTGVPGEQKENGAEAMFEEIMAEIFQN